MYDFNEGQPLSGLLEQVKGAAVAVAGNVVADYNSAAGRILPGLREGDRFGEPEPGVIELGGASFEAACFELGEYRVYTFAVPAATAVDDAAALLENLGMMIMNSLNTSFAASELIAGAAEREQQEMLQKYNAILRHEQYKLLHIAENLRELAELSAPGDPLSRSLFELDELCARVIETAGAMLKEREIRFCFSAHGGDFMAYADERRVERMILDVLANSAAKCGAGCTVSLSLKRDSSRYLLMIDDDGDGIAEELYPDVFDTYVRPLRPEEEPRGMGLSLSVARNVALRHGGKFVLQSKPGEGTRVLISLPVTHPRNIELHSSRVEYAANPLRPVLTAFANVLDYKFYAPPYL